MKVKLKKKRAPEILYKKSLHLTLKFPNEFSKEIPKNSNIF